jgi:HipA-like C-terminal domain
MNDAFLDLPAHLHALLAQGTPLSARQLQSLTGKSQPSISLALAKLGSEVCKLGAARSTHYALTQPILGLPAQQTLTWTAPDGFMQTFGSLCFLQGGQVYVRTPQGADWLSAPGQLPWFLQPLRPQGFLGRQLTRLRPDFPADPDNWRTEQVLYMAINHAGDPPGALHAGETRGRIVLKAPWALPDRAAYFDTLARAVTETLPAASSAGGEQPKFIAETNEPGGQHKHLIVKFSPPRGTPFGERWHDLLQLEHLALSVLAENGVSTPSARILESGVRTYMESERFDRLGREGKRHVVDASAVHDAFVKSPRRHWVATCEALYQQKTLASEHLKTVAGVYLFGQYIGNTDMHFGNLSFFVDDVTKPAFIPTPVYDMLPMMWRPGVHDGSLDVSPVRAQPQPAGFEAQAALARAWATQFWDRAAQLPGLSAPLRQASAMSAIRLRSNFSE